MELDNEGSHNYNPFRYNCGEGDLGPQLTIKSEFDFNMLLKSHHLAGLGWLGWAGLVVPPRVISDEPLSHVLGPAQPSPHLSPDRRQSDVSMVNNG